VRRRWLSAVVRATRAWRGRREHARGRRGRRAAAQARGQQRADAGAEARSEGQARELSGGWAERADERAERAARPRLGTGRLGLGAYRRDAGADPAVRATVCE
jgi:hypothetical protein